MFVSKTTEVCACLQNRIIYVRIVWMAKYEGRKTNKMQQLDVYY